MKIRQDFVTNSSSSSYILIGRHISIKDALKAIKKDIYLVGVVDSACGYSCDGGIQHITIKDATFAKVVKKHLDKLDGWITWYNPLAFFMNDGDEISLQEVLDKVKGQPTEGIILSYGECTINTITNEEELQYLLEAIDREDKN